MRTSQPGSGSKSLEAVCRTKASLSLDHPKEFNELPVEVAGLLVVHRAFAFAFVAHDVQLVSMIAA